jgi:hypothetical protein
MLDKQGVHSKSVIKNANKQNSGFAQRMLDTGHTYSAVDQTMEVLHIERKDLN